MVRSSPLVIFGLLLALSPSAFPQSTTRISVDSAGVESDGYSSRPSFSADNRFVVFSSGGKNLVPNDTNGKTDIFVHDRLTGEVTRVSVDSQGVEGNGWSSRPSISADGRYVAFASDADNLVAGDNNFLEDIFVHDRLLKTTIRVNISTQGD